jgi:hypothetical protein
MSDDSKLEPSIASPSRRSSKKKLLVYTLLLCMLFSSVFLLCVAFSASIYHRDRLLLSSDAEADSLIMLSPCGSNPAEARTAGCVFDMMAFS